MLPQAWGLPDPAAPSASSGTTLPPASAPPTPEVTAAAAAPAGSGDTEAGLPPFAVSRAMIGESCGLGGDAYGRFGADVDMFLEQAVIAVGGWVLRGCCDSMLLCCGAHMVTSREQAVVVLRWCCGHTVVWLNNRVMLLSCMPWCARMMEMEDHT